MLNHLKKDSPLKQPNDSQMDTNDEFAKLDALLADLLMEVEQPILLNKGTAKVLANTNEFQMLQNLDQIESSIDYLTEQKEKLKLKKHLYQKVGNNDVIFEEDIDHEPPNQPFRTIKSKFDSYISNSNDQELDNNMIKNNSLRNADLNVQTNNCNKLHKTQMMHHNAETSQRPVALSPYSYQLQNERHNYAPSPLTNQAISSHLHSIGAGKIENDDDFECSSMKSGFSTASAVQRSKYHTISNNYVESTGPNIPGRQMQTKRAFSAPPADMGKIVLQRIELKSPLTIRNPSQTSINQNFDSSSLVTPNNFQNKTLINRYNNRNILKTNTLQPQPQRGLRAFSERPQNFGAGYDTDTGVLDYNQRQLFNTQYQHGRRYADFDSDSEQLKFSQNRNTNDLYNKRIVDGSGYDTDTGLINARKSLNQRLINQKYEMRSTKAKINDGNLTMPVFTNSRLHSDINTNSSSNYNINESTKEPLKVKNESLRNYNSRISSFEKVDSKENKFENDFDQRNKLITNDNVDHTNKSAFQSITRKNLKQDNFSNTNRSDDLTRNQHNLLIAVNNDSFETHTNKTNKKVTTNSINMRSSSVPIINEEKDASKPWKFVQDVQNYWYKPKISREDAINLLKDKVPGTFLIRDSNNFPGAYGLALKVEKLPPNIPIKPNSDQSIELVRHFLIEPTTGGVRIKGCCNEPVFENLSSLVYQHLLTPLALPLKLILITNNPQNSVIQNKGIQKSEKIDITHESLNSNSLLEKGAACHVYFLNSTNVSQTNGFIAIKKAVDSLNYANIKDNSQLILTQFKVNSQGIFVTDLNRKKFVREVFPSDTILYCAIEENKIWPCKIGKIEQPRIFGIVCKSRENENNQCHLFVELDSEQPAIAIVDFINRYLIPTKSN